MCTFSGLYINIWEMLIAPVELSTVCSVQLSAWVLGGAGNEGSFLKLAFSKTRRCCFPKLRGKCHQAVIKTEGSFQHSASLYVNVDWEQHQSLNSLNYYVLMIA